MIDKLFSIPWVEVQVYSAGAGGGELFQPELPTVGMVQPGPASGGYTVPEGTKNLPRELYVLRLKGDTAAYLGRPDKGALTIVKIGLSVSPKLRCQSLQKAMPRGAFLWELVKSTRKDGDDLYSGFSAAVEGENAMKRHLAKNSEWLGGEFYLAL